MTNTLTVAEIKHRGMAAMEEGFGAAPCISASETSRRPCLLIEEEYQRLAHGRVATPIGMTATQWLLSQPAMGVRSNAQIGKDLQAKRNC